MVREHAPGDTVCKNPVCKTQFQPMTKPSKFLLSFLRSIRRAGIWLLLLIVAYAVVGTLLSLVPVNRNVGSGGDVVIYLETNGVHTDIAMPTVTERIDWSKVVLPDDTVAKVKGEYLAFGWGSQDFYLNVPTWGDLTIGVALKAISGTGGTSLHTRYENAPKEDNSCRRIVLSAEQYDALVKYVLASGKREGEGSFVRIEHDGYGRYDAFYVGTGRYSPFFTCNTWANSALKACGQKACLWTALQQPIFWKYQ